MSVFPPCRMIFAGCIWLGICGSGRAAPEDAPVSNDYVLRTWEMEDGLPQNTVSGIAQTPDGYLWLATWDGLARFDGVRFTPFIKDAASGLESSYVRTVATDRTGALWVGLERGGVARMRGNGFETVLPVAPPTTTTRWVSSFSEDASGAMWFGAAPDLTVWRWKDGILSAFSEKDGIGPGTDTFVHADFKGRIWFATKMACGIFDGTRFQPIDPNGGERTHLAQARDGRMWAARDQGLFHYFSDGSLDEVADLGWLGGAIEVTVLFEDRAGDLWLGTRGAGLFRFHAGAFVRVPTSRKSVLAIFEDRDGSLWIGTMGGGLNRLRRQRFFLHDTGHGLSKEGVLSLCEDSDRRLWLGVFASAPVRAVDATNQTFATPEAMKNTAANVVCPDPSGGVWFSTTVGLGRWRDGVYTVIDGDKNIASLLRDREGNIWMATMHDGLIRWRDNAEHLEPTENGLLLARALAEDAAGDIWAGTDDGLVFRREAGRFTQIPLPGAKSGESIRFIVADGAETVWIGAREGGLLRWHDGHIERLPHDAGLRDHDLRALLIDSSGNFWFAHGGGLFRTSRQNLVEVLEGRQRKIPGVAYGRDDGLPNSGFVFGRRNATAQTTDGRLWFGTDRGALEIDPRMLNESAPLARLLMEEMRVGGEPVSLASRSPITLPPRPGPVEIRYTVPRLSAPDRLRFRYRLAGLDNDWTDAQNQRTATFPRLPAGNYRLEVAASDLDAQGAAEVLAALSFSIRAAWWETGIFRASAWLFGLFALAALVRMLVLRRVRVRIRALEQLHALEKERARIARDMHDDVGASLTRIALMSDLAAGEPDVIPAISERFGEIAQAARSVSGTLDEIVWTVNPRNDTLERLVGYIGEFASEYLESTGVGLHLELPAEISVMAVPSDTRHQVLMAIKEALNNIVKHSGAPEASLRVRLEGEKLTIIVADRGRGFGPGVVPASANGLQNMVQRMETIGGSARLENGSDGGVSVTFNVPLAPAN